MAVKVVEKQTGASVTGKFAVIQGGQVSLYSGIMSDKKGGFRGCGKKTGFPADGVEVMADNPAQELKQS